MADVILHSRYLRDCSFENPSAPADGPDSEAPLLDIDVGLDTRRCGDLHEVTLSMLVTARRKERVSFLIEVQYAGLFEIGDLGPEGARRFLFAEGPRLLFPFAERICADLARDGGLRQFAVSPPDFEALYRARTGAIDAPVHTDS